MIKVVVTGSKGRMGGRVADIVRGSKDLDLIAEIDKGDSLESNIGRADVAIDFTIADAAVLHAEISAKHGKAIVLGTTGLNGEQQRLIADCAKKIPIVQSPNMSIGVNLMWKLIEISSKALGRQFHIDIVETHHVHKLDKPSGTAKRMLDIILEKTGRDVNKDVFFYDEKTQNEEDSKDTEVSVRSIRRGEVVGDHVIHFTSPGEILSIEHHAATRDIFAEGAVAAARWIAGKGAGLYTMEDVLGLKGIG